MSKGDDGVVALPASQDRATAAEPVVSALRDGIPSAGDDPRLVAGLMFQPASYDGKPRWLPKRYKTLFASFVEPLWERLEAMSDADLWELIKGCRAVSPINCGWSDYAMAKLLHDVAVWDLRNRLSAQAMSAGTAETLQAAQGQRPASAVGSADAPEPRQDTPETPRQGANP